MKALLLDFLFLITLSVNSVGQVSRSNFQAENNNLPLPTVDKRIELLSIVFRLAGNFEYNMDMFKNYVNDIHNHFDEYKNHPLITFASELRNKNGVGFDAVMSMAIHLEQPPSLNPIFSFTSGQPEKRWGKENAEKFVTLLKQFYVDAKCEEFFNQHESLYNTAQERFKTVFNAFDISWYKKYYGAQPTGKFNIIISLGNGGGNYGPKITFPNGKEEIYAIMGTWSTDNLGEPLYDADKYLPTLIHEFNHSFVNHLIEKNEKELESSGTILFQPIKDIMKRQAYSEWQTMMKEALVRASVIRYIKSHNSDNTIAENELINQIGNGFVWMKSLVDTLEFYEKNHLRYPTLESFMPNIILYYNNLAQNSKSLFEKCAHVKSLEPFENNSLDVSPDISEMKVIFDKPLSNKSFSMRYGSKGKEHYPIVEKGIRFADDNRSVILNIKLAPNTEYQFVLVGQSFKTTDGYPLIDYQVAFKTKE